MVQGIVHKKVNVYNLSKLNEFQLISFDTSFYGEIHRFCTSHALSSCFYQYDDIPVRIVELFVHSLANHVNLVAVSGHWLDDLWGSSELAPTQSSFILVSYPTSNATTKRQDYLSDYRTLRNTLGYQMKLAISTESVISSPNLIGEDLMFQTWKLSHLCLDNIHAWKQILADWRDLSIGDWFIYSPYRSISVEMKKELKFIEFNEETRMTHDIISISGDIRLEGLLSLSPSSPSSHSILRSSLNSSSEKSSRRVSIRRTISDSHRRTFHSWLQVRNDEEYPLEVEILDFQPVYFTIMLSTYEYTLSQWRKRHSVADLNTFHWTHDSYNEEGGQTTLYSWKIVLLPNSSLEVRFTAFKEYLSREIHVGDTSRGLDVYPTILFKRAYSHVNKENEWEVLVSEGGLITSPFPDFTMPFNVITLACTTVAFFLGSMMNAIMKPTPSISASLTSS